MKRQRIIVRILIYIAIVLSILLILYANGIRLKELSPEMIKKIAHDNILNILIIMLVVMTMQNLFTFIPLILVISINIALFGFWKGYLYSAFCSTVGSTLIFFLIRYLFPSLFSTAMLEKYKDKVEKNGFLFVLSARVMPFLPTNITNIVSGLSTVKASHFFLAAAIGNFTYGLVLASASFSVIALVKHHPVYVIIALVVVVSIVLIIHALRKQHKLKTIEQR